MKVCKTCGNRRKPSSFARKRNRQCRFCDWRIAYEAQAEKHRDYSPPMHNEVVARCGQWCDGCHKDQPPGAWDFTIALTSENVCLECTERTYVRQLLAKAGRCSASIVPPELVEFKRKHLRLVQLLKEKMSEQLR